VRARTVDTVTALTAQESYIARLACGGRELRTALDNLGPDRPAA